MQNFFYYFCIELSNTHAMTIIEITLSVVTLLLGGWDIIQVLQIKELRAKAKADALKISAEAQSISAEGDKSRVENFREIMDIYKAELASLQSRYDNLQSRYDTLLAKYDKQQDQIAELKLLLTQRA